MKFSTQQINELTAPLKLDVVKSRTQAGRKLSYVEAWHAIAEANRIFGFDAWTRETVDVRCVCDHPRTIGAQKKPGFGVSYIAKVRVTIGDIVREGTGAGHGIDVDQGQAHESAIKEAESDAMKRALMTFGNPFGLALYDKEMRNVDDEPTAQPVQAPVQPATPTVRPALATSNGRAAPATRDPVAQLRDLARNKAREGVRAFDKWWNTLTDEQCNELGAIAEELAEIGHAAAEAELARA